MKHLKNYFTKRQMINIVYCAVFITLFSTSPSFAQNFSGVNTFLQAIVSAITGPIGQAVSALAVIAVGFSFMIGRMDWTFAVSVVLGIAIVFGGATFVNNITVH